MSVQVCPKCGSGDLQSDTEYTPGGVDFGGPYPPDYWEYTFCQHCDWRSDQFETDDDIPF